MAKANRGLATGCGGPPRSVSASRSFTNRLLGLAALALVAAAAPAAQPVRADTTAEVRAATPDSTQSRVRGAVLRSLALPGWGQVYNGEAYKAPFALGLVVGAGAFGVVQQNRYLLYRRAAFYANCDAVPDQDVCEGFESRRAAWEEATDGRTVAVPSLETIRDGARSNRDLAFVAVIGVYALQALDAYVAAQLSSFDVSEELSLHVTPAPRGAVLTLHLDL